MGQTGDPDEDFRRGGGVVLPAQGKGLPAGYYKLPDGTAMYVDPASGQVPREFAALVSQPGGIARDPISNLPSNFIPATGGPEAAFQKSQRYTQAGGGEIAEQARTNRVTKINSRNYMLVEFPQLTVPVGVTSAVKKASPSSIRLTRARCWPSTSTLTVPSGNLSICKMVETQPTSNMSDTRGSSLAAAF